MERLRLPAVPYGELRTSVQLPLGLPCRIPLVRGVDEVLQPSSPSSAGAKITLSRMGSSRSTAAVHSRQTGKREFCGCSGCLRPSRGSLCRYAAPEERPAATQASAAVQKLSALHCTVIRDHIDTCCWNPEGVEITRGALSQRAWSSSSGYRARAHRPPARCCRAEQLPRYQEPSV